MKILVEGLKSRVKATEDRTSELQDEMHKTSRQEQEMEKCLKINSRQENSGMNSRGAI